MVSDYPKVTYRRHTFFSALGLGLAGVIITLIVCCTVIIIYGMHFAGEKSQAFVSLAQDAVQGLPTLEKSLPPVLADLLNDHRQPDYRTQLQITAKTAPWPDQNGKLRTSVTVANNGPEVVSLLSLRVVVLDPQGRILTESNEWAATPFAAKHDWRGPLMPGSVRYFTCSGGDTAASPADNLRTEVEITDVRIWNGAGTVGRPIKENAPSTGAPKPAETTKPTPAATEPAGNM
jgi:hypothetical protein